MARRTTRTSISIPPELKARMAAVEEDVNWSAVACRAFEQVLADIVKRRGTRDMNDVIERLRASRQKTEGRRAREGVEAGREWAMQEAEAEELERLAAFYQTCLATSWGWRGFFEPTGRFSGAELLAFAILGLEEDQYDADTAKRFWRSAIGADGSGMTGEFAEGFVEGALEIWHAVEDKL